MGGRGRARAYESGKACFSMASVRERTSCLLRIASSVCWLNPVLRTRHCLTSIRLMLSNVLEFCRSRRVRGRRLLPTHSTHSFCKKKMRMSGAPPRLPGPPSITRVGLSRDTWTGEGFGFPFLAVLGLRLLLLLLLLMRPGPAFRILR